MATSDSSNVGKIIFNVCTPINAIMLQNAIKIYYHWKTLDAEVSSISTRGINFPCELSEIFACYTLGYEWKKNGGGDAFDARHDKIIEIKASGSNRSDLSSFSPVEEFDELIFCKVKKDEDVIYIWKTGVNSDELKKIKVSKKETVADQQKAGKRPRFSVEKQIIKEKGLTPDFKFDIQNKTIIDLKKGQQ